MINSKSFHKISFLDSIWNYVVSFWLFDCDTTIKWFLLIFFVSICLRAILSLMNVLSFEAFSKKRRLSCNWIVTILDLKQSRTYGICLWLFNFTVDNYDFILDRRLIKLHKFWDFIENLLCTFFTRISGLNLTSI